MHFLTFGTLTVCDVTLSVDAGSRVQQQFYVQGILASQDVLLGRGPFGHEYRPGIVHFPAETFTHFTTTALTLSVDNPAFGLLTTRRIHQATADTTCACQITEQATARGQLPSPADVDAMLQHLTQLMAYKVLYDLIPEDDLIARLSDFLQDDDLAAQLYQSLHYTDALPHYTQVNLGLLDLALTTAETGRADPAAFIRSLGFAFDFYIHESELETPAGVHAHVQRLVDEHDCSPERLRATIQDIHAGRQRQQALSRQAWERLRRTQSRHSPDDTLSLLAALKLHQALGEVEEQRHLLQMRVQRNLRDLLDHLGLDRVTSDLDTLRRHLTGASALVRA